MNEVLDDRGGVDGGETDGWDERERWMGGWVGGWEWASYLKGKTEGAALVEEDTCGVGGWVGWVKEEEVV